MAVTAASVTCSPSPSPTSPHLPSDQRDHEKFCKHFFYKAAQIVVQSRLGERASSHSQPSPSSSSAWFNLAIKDIPEVAFEARRIYAGGCNGSHTIEISLKTTEGDSMVLENWCVSMNSEVKDPSIKLNNAVYNHLGLLIKSVLCVTRVTPAYKFSRRQGPDTFVVCYRLFAGEPPSQSSLGHGCQSCEVGQVSTPVGSISVKVDYRTEMTITPTASMTSNLILVKSDHFDLGSNTTPAAGRKSKSSDDSSAALTSDDSQEAYRLFSSDTPNPPPNQPSSNDDSESSRESVSEAKIKLGAFATNSKLNEILEDDDNDPLFSFLPQEYEEDDNNVEENVEDNVEDNLEDDTSSAAVGVQEFEVLDNPFTDKFEGIRDLPSDPIALDEPTAAIPSKSEFGIFFKDAPFINLGNGHDLEDINKRLSSFEKNLETYDQMIKTLDSVNSESESEET